MSFIEHILASIAPHICEGCEVEGVLLCANCVATLEPSIEMCYQCRKFSQDGKTCKSCRSQSKLVRVIALTSYNGLAKQLVWRLKFKRARAAGDEIGRLLATFVTDLDDALVVHVPTATSRVRRRGYDQSAVIARRLAKQRKWRYYPLLSRRGQHKQVGASGTVRRARMEHAFQVRRPALAAGRTILLVDDVITTGTTLEAAAKTLKAAGAKRVEAVVFARA